MLWYNSVWEFDPGGGEYWVPQKSISNRNKPFRIFIYLYILDFHGLKPGVAISARDTVSRYWRFIRRHLFGLGPITQCQMVLGHQATWRDRGPDITSPPTPMLALGPTGETRARTAGGDPPSPSGRHVTPIRRRGDAADPPRRAWSRDSAVRAQVGPTAGS
jgi:hypothetical protein